MCVEELRLKVTRPELFLRKLQIIRESLQNCLTDIIVPSWGRSHYMLWRQQGIRRIYREPAVV